MLLKFSLSFNLGFNHMLVLKFTLADSFSRNFYLFYIFFVVVLKKEYFISNHTFIFNALHDFFFHGNYIFQI